MKPTLNKTKFKPIKYSLTFLPSEDIIQQTKEEWRKWFKIDKFEQSTFTIDARDIRNVKSDFYIAFRKKSLWKTKW